MTHDLQTKKKHTIDNGTFTIHTIKYKFIYVT